MTNRAAQAGPKSSRETRWKETTGTVNCTPRDDEHHTFVTAMSPDFASAVVLMPDGHPRGCLASEENETRIEFHRILAKSDPVLRACMMRLTANTPSAHIAPDTRVFSRLTGMKPAKYRRRFARAVG